MKQVPVQQNDIEKLCKKHNLQYFETSAKTGDGVEACLLAAVSILLQILSYYSVVRICSIFTWRYRDTGI